MGNRFTRPTAASVASAAAAIACALACACAGAALAGCSGSQQEAPASHEPVTIKVDVPTLTMSTFADDEVVTAYQFIQKAASAFAAQCDGDVTVDVVEFEIADEATAVADTFGTPDAPDVLFEGYFNMESYIHDGVVVPLDDIITDEMRADVPETYWELSTFDGKTYMMPFLHVQNTLAFNKELFEQAGLDAYVADADAVQTWTLEQWDEVLAALRESLPDTAYPMMMYAGDNQGDTHIMTLLRSRGCDFFDEEGRFCVNTPEGVEALRWLKESYDAGYFPTGADTLVIMDNYNLFTQQKLGIYVGNATQSSVMADEGGFDVLSVNFPSRDGGLATSFVTGFEVFDNGDPERLAVAKDFVRFVYESDFLDYSAGGIPVSGKVAEKYAAELEPLRKYIDNADANWNFTGNHPNWLGVRDVFHRHIQDLLFGTATPEEAAAAIDADCNAAIEEGHAESVLHE